jgi:hypothetical protein
MPKPVVNLRKHPPRVTDSTCNLPGSCIARTPRAAVGDRPSPVLSQQAKGGVTPSSGEVHAQSLPAPESIAQALTRVAIRAGTMRNMSFTMCDGSLIDANLVQLCPMTPLCNTIQA